MTSDLYQIIQDNYMREFFSAGIAAFTGVAAATLDNLAPVFNKSFYKTPSLIGISTACMTIPPVAHQPPITSLVKGAEYASISAISFTASYYATSAILKYMNAKNLEAIRK
jgi:hypothetical protein